MAFAQEAQIVIGAVEDEFVFFNSGQRRLN